MNQPPAVSRSRIVSEGAGGAVGGVDAGEDEVWGEKVAVDAAYGEEGVEY